MVGVEQEGGGGGGPRHGGRARAAAGARAGAGGWVTGHVLLFYLHVDVIVRQAGGWCSPHRLDSHHLLPRACAARCSPPDHHVGELVDELLLPVTYRLGGSGHCLARARGREVRVGDVLARTCLQGEELISIRYSSSIPGT